MLIPDLELGRRFLAANPPPGEVLSCGATGAHLYGFPSPDSDLDLKGIHLASTESVLGLRRMPEAFDRLEVAEFSAKALLDTAMIGRHVPIGEEDIADLKKAFNLAEED